MASLERKIEELGQNLSSAEKKVSEQGGLIRTYLVSESDAFASDSD